MLKLVPFALLVCSVSAVRFYGHATPAHIGTSHLQHLYEILEDELQYDSMFFSKDLQSQNGSDFLAKELGVTGMTLMEYFAEEDEEQLPTSATILPAAHVTPSTSISGRDTVDQLRCSHNAVEDKISPGNQKHICNFVSAFAAIPAGAIAMIVNSRQCNEATSGAAVACKTVVLITGVTGTTWSANEANQFCLDKLSANDKQCSSQGLSASQDKASMTVRNTQTGPTCENYDHCQEFNA
ncbi:hypothetical protein N7508_009695 [Penicillium antarcticum]|uniref:uncharacterized protein n=1 Tax=Penicillium antarcticum TaxID=416450 RepID=UPI0023A3C928|nr:uncharacterized protein N7508_009695 [Penicillium antarcticum]KAJ5294874.1 hypothetical protein N7508_009695 [Penicillium antarcticum]